jgi:hypothetical protein
MIKEEKMDTSNFRKPCIVKGEKPRGFNPRRKSSNFAYIGSPFDGSVVKVEFDYVKPKRGIKKVLDRLF